MKIVSLGDNLHEMPNLFFSGKNKKKISKCRLHKTLPSMLNVKVIQYGCTNRSGYKLLVHSDLLMTWFFIAQFWIKRFCIKMDPKNVVSKLKCIDYTEK